MSPLQIIWHIVATVVLVGADPNASCQMSDFDCLSAAAEESALIQSRKSVIAHSVGSLQSQIPFANLFGDLAHKHRQVALEWTRYRKIWDEIGTKGGVFNAHLKLFKCFHVYVTSLLIVLPTTTLSKSNYTKWKAAQEIQNIPSPPNQSSVVAALQDVDGFFATLWMGTAVVRFAKTAPIVKDLYKWVGDALSKVASVIGSGLTSLARSLSVRLEGSTVDGLVDDVASAGEEVGLEGVAESAARATARSVLETGASTIGKLFGMMTLEKTGGLVLGGAIFAAVGIDAILGAIQGHKEAGELDHEIQKLTGAVDKCEKFLHHLREAQANLTNVEKIAKQSFVHASVQLNKIQPAPEFLEQEFKSLSASTPLSEWKRVAQLASRHYGAATGIRHTIEKFVNNNMTNWNMITTMLMFQRNKNVTKAEEKGYINYVADHVKEYAKMRAAS